MKRIFLFIALSMLIILPTQAQLRFGVKGGVNISSLTTSGGSFSSENVTGFQVGPSLEWMIHHHIGLEGALVYSQKGIKGKDGTDKPTGYIELPVNLKWRLGLAENFKPFIAAGPYINVKVSGDDSFDTTIDNIQSQLKAQSFGAGVNLGAGIELFKFLQVGANYGIGLTDNYKASNGDFKAQDRTWSVTATVYF